MLNKEQIDKLVKMRQHSEMMFVGPYSKACRFVDHFTDDEKKGPRAILDDGGEIPLSFLDVTFKDFVLVMRIPE